MKHWDVMHGIDYPAYSQMTSRSYKSKYIPYVVIDSHEHRNDGNLSLSFRVDFVFDNYLELQQFYESDHIIVNLMKAKMLNGNANAFEESLDIYFEKYGISIAHKLKSFLLSIIERCDTVIKYGVIT